MTVSRRLASATGLATGVEREPAVVVRKGTGTEPTLPGFFSTAFSIVLLNRLVNMFPALRSPADIERARELQETQGGRLGEILIALGCIDEATLTETLAEQYELPRVSLADVVPQPDFARYVNAIYSTKHGVVPIGILGRSLTVAIHDPAQRGLAIELESSTGLRVHVVLATRSEVENHAVRIYGSAAEEPISTPIPLALEGTS